mmetsp:Transcript_237/g.451  ORF Transcript_237/g.451 Transcript_237/m.451 type:complete len:242 (+) Transcript_237:491-1216(+)
MSFTVPTLSTAFAALSISNGLPGTKPTAMTKPCAPWSVLVSALTSSFSTSSCSRATTDVSTDGTFCTIAPRTVTEFSSSAFFALATLRTPPMTFRPPLEASRSRMRRPVWPVAPATTNFGSSASAGAAAVKVAAAAAALRPPRIASRRDTSDIATIGALCLATLAAALPPECKRAPRAGWLNAVAGSRARTSVASACKVDSEVASWSRLLCNCSSAACSRRPLPMQAKQAKTRITLRMAMI